MKKSKQPKLPTTQELEAVLTAFIASRGRKEDCECFKCQMATALHECTIDALLFALGRPPKKFANLVRAMKRDMAKATKDHISHAE